MMQTETSSPNVLCTPSKNLLISPVLSWARILPLDHFCFSLHLYISQELENRLQKAVQNQVLEPVALHVEMELRRQLPAAREASGSAADSSPAHAISAIALLRLPLLHVLDCNLSIRSGLISNVSTGDGMQTIDLQDLDSQLV